MPFLFRNKKDKDNYKWITFDNNSSSYNNRNITLTECKECEEYTTTADMPDSDINNTYMIKLEGGTDCLFSDENNVLASETCDKEQDSHKYEMRQIDPEYMNQLLPSELYVSITFNDNKTANINSSKYNRGGRLTKLSHVYNSDTSKTKIYDILKDPTLYDEGKPVENPILKEFLMDNLSVRCKLFHVIEEYDSDDDLIAKTIYRLKYIDKASIGDITDDSIAGILMYVDSTEIELESSSSEDNDVVISYFGKKKYDETSSLSDINKKNVSKAYIGTVLYGVESYGVESYGYIDTDEYMGGIIIKEVEDTEVEDTKTTVFRVVPNNTIFNYMINYSYPNQNVSELENVNLNMSSFVNPFKKIFVKKNKTVISKNIKDGTQKRGAVFNVVPVSESFSGQEGFSFNANTVQSSSSMISGISAQSSSSIISGISTQPELSIQQQITALNNMLVSATPFNEIITHIDNILNNMNTNNAESEYAHIVTIYKSDMENIKHCFTVAESMYDNMSKLHKIMIDNYKKIGMNNVYGNSGDGTNINFNSSIIQTVNQQVKKLKKEISVTKSRFNNNYNLSLIEVDTSVILVLIEIFNYFDRNRNDINYHVDAFFDYNEAIKKIDYLKKDSFLKQIKLYDTYKFNYDKFMKMGRSSLKKVIKMCEKLKSKSKTFFDLDFGEIYNQLFVDAEKGPRKFRKNRIEKILHQDDSIVSQFIDSDENRGVMHYYYDLLVSQKAYYESFKQIEFRNTDIQNFKTNLPNSEEPSFIFEYYVSYGKKLDSGGSYFYTLMNYYSELSVSSSDTDAQKEYFLALFKNLTYYNDKGVLFPTVDYSSIKKDDLYKYYESNYFIDKKSEPSIIKAFMNKEEYIELKNAIQVSVGGVDTEIISINDSGLNVGENTVNIETFSSMNIDSSDYHPSKPTVISSTSSSDYDTTVFNNAFLYDTDSGAVDLNSYLESQYDGGAFDGTSASCNDTAGSSITPNIIMSYSCGSTSGYTYGGDGTDGNDYKYVNDFLSSDGEASCKSSTLYFNVSVSLEYENQSDTNTCVLKLVNSNGTTYTLLDNLPHTDYLETFDTENGVTSLTTIYEGPGSENNKMDYLEDIYTEESSSASSVLYNAESGESNRYFRLYIQNGEIKVDYKASRGLAIDKTGTNVTDMKGIVDPTISLSSRENKTLYMYKNDKNVGEHLNQSVYVDSAGVSHNIDSSKLNTSITKSGTDIDNSVYTDYDNYCYSGTLTSNVASEDSVAKFNGYYLDKSELNNVYPSDGTCIDGTTASTLQLKRNEFNSDHGACVTDASSVNMMDIDKYQSLSSVSGQFDDSKCDKKHVFNGAVTKFKDARGKFRDVFANMIEKFNELNETEIEMLDGTQESIDNLKQTIKEYNSLYKRASENENKKKIIDAQTNDSEIILEKTQYGMAAMGIGAIGITMLMFNYMKNS